MLQHACRCYQQVTCKAVTIRNLSTANELVDTAIAAALQEKKPVLIQVRLKTENHAAPSACPSCRPGRPCSLTSQRKLQCHSHSFLEELLTYCMQVCCNLATMTHPLFERQPVPYALSPKTSNPRSLDAAVSAAAEMLSKVGSLAVCSLCGAAGASSTDKMSPFLIDT